MVALANGHASPLTTVPANDLPSVAEMLAPVAAAAVTAPPTQRITTTAIRIEIRPRVNLRRVKEVPT
jgi:hypothetical protein